MAIPMYTWFDQAPEYFRTRRQLAEEGLRPGGPIVATVEWGRGRKAKIAYLYDKTQAKPKQAPTEVQLAALAKAKAKRSTCPYCGANVGFVLPRRWRAKDCPNCEDTLRSADRDAAIHKARAWLASPDTVILDTETTDLDGYLVQVAAIDTSGNVLLDTFVDPQNEISPGAYRVHHIGDEELRGAPTFPEIAEQLWSVLEGKRIVTYNAAFDSSILTNEVERCVTNARITPRNERYEYVITRDGHVFYDTRSVACQLLAPLKWRCAMKLSAKFIGDWSNYHGNYRWYPLAGGDHTALGDARACLAELQSIAAAKTVEEQEHVG